MIYFHRSDQNVSSDLEKDLTIVFSDILYWQEITIYAIILCNPYIPVKDRETYAQNDHVP